MLDYTNYLTDLISAGSDAMSNLFYVEIDNSKLPDKVGLIVREQDFTPPTFNQPTTSIAFMTTKMDVPTAQYQGSKELKLVFRLDNNYKGYKALLYLQSATSKLTVDYAGTKIDTDTNKKGFNINVYAIKGDVSSPADLTPMNPLSDKSKFILFYKYENCWIKDISGFNYSYSGSNPMKITASISFQKFTDTSDNV